MWAQVIVVGLVGLVAAYPKRLVLAFGVGVKSVTRIILALRGHTPTSYAEARVVSGQVFLFLFLFLFFRLSLSLALSISLSCGCKRGRSSTGHCCTGMSQSDLGPVSWLLQRQSRSAVCFPPTLTPVLW